MAKNTESADFTARDPTSQYGFHPAGVKSEQLQKGP